MQHQKLFFLISGFSLAMLPDGKHGMRKESITPEDVRKLFRALRERVNTALILIWDQTQINIPVESTRSGTSNLLFEPGVPVTLPARLDFLRESAQIGLEQADVRGPAISSWNVDHARGLGQASVLLNAQGIAEPPGPDDRLIVCNWVVKTDTPVDRPTEPPYHEARPDRLYGPTSEVTVISNVPATSKKVGLEVTFHSIKFIR